MGKKISFYDYVASNNPQGVEELVASFGNYPRTRSKRELSMFLKDIVRNSGEDALKGIAKIHPDKELIESIGKSEEFSNACGCESFTTFDGKTYTDPSKCGQHSSFVGADGESSEEGSKENKGGISQSTLNTMLIGSIMVLGIASLIKKI